MIKTTGDEFLVGFVSVVDALPVCLRPQSRGSAFFPGGLAVATNMACAGFAAASGSSLATTTEMGRITIPEMLHHEYDPGPRPTSWRAWRLLESQFLPESGNPTAASAFPPHQKTKYALWSAAALQGVTGEWLTPVNPVATLPRCRPDVVYFGV